MAETANKPPEEMGRRELREKVAVMVGCRPYGRSPLRKTTLNSAHAYLTGEFYYPRAARRNENHPEWKSRDEVQYAVVAETGIGEPEDEWMPPPGPDRPYFKTEELRTLVEEMQDTGDQRDWT